MASHPVHANVNGSTKAVIAGLIVAWMGAITAAAASGDIPVPVPKPWNVGSGERPEPSFFKIATGSPGGTYFPIGSALAAIVSHPANSERCGDDERLCGPAGMQAVAQNSDGSVRNILAVNRGEVSSALAQADLVAAARDGRGPFAMPGKQKNVRAIAGLYEESLHLVVAATSDIESVRDLEGARISIGPKASGTHDTARAVLKAFGLGDRALKLSEHDAVEAADGLVAGELDGFFFIGGTPVPVVAQLVEIDAVRLVPIEGPEIAALVKSWPMLHETSVPATAYGTESAIATLGVTALWIVHKDVSEDRVYRITRALWQDDNRDILKASHPIAASMRVDRAVDDLPVPLHPGAAKFYREIGLLPGKPGGEEAGTAPTTGKTDTVRSG